MPRRKFYFGDLVLIKGDRYPTHVGHQAEILRTHIKTKRSGLLHRVAYEVQCECRAVLRMEAKNMDIFLRPYEEGYKENLPISRKRISNFLNRYPEVRANDKGVVLTMTLDERLAALLSPLDRRSQSIIMKYYGLEGRPGKSMEEVGKPLGISRERVRQLLRRAMEKLYEH